MKQLDPLNASELYQACDENDLAITTTVDIDPKDNIIGQERAIQAIDFAVAMDIDGHNLFVLGPPGTGRRTLVQRVLSDAAKKRPVPSDWCYVNNFDDPKSPTALELPAGRAKTFAQQMETFIEDVRTTLVATFQGEDYRRRQQSIEAEFQQQQSESVEQVHKTARERKIRIMQTPSGVIFAPIKDGQALGPEDFEKLPEEEQRKIERDVDEISAQLQAAMADMPAHMRKMREQISQLNNEVTSFAIGSLIKELISEYSDFPRIVDFLKSVETDLIEHSALLVQNPNEQAPFMQLMPERATEKRYAVNVVVSCESDGSAPVVYEERPAYTHLLGRIEHQSHMGTLTTDLTLIRGGALHRANGGYLILDARRVLSEPFAWDALKQALKSRAIKIESAADAYGLTTTVALEPEPIPLNVKVTLVGDRRLYYLLQAFDPEFDDLFKVAADFDNQTARTVESQREFASMMAAIIERNGLHPLRRDGMYRVIEEAVRSAGDQDKLSTEIRRTEDLLREGHYWAKKDGREEIIGEDIDKAIASRDYRHGRVRERTVEAITQGTVLIDTEGAKVGQVNALAVYQLGDYAFGRPNRVSARVSLGSGKVIDIEREAELGGSLHSKGILILSGFIAANYITDKPLSLSASIAFEQSYGGVDGDSASSAELYALLSAICGVPLKQSYAVTGSVNQFGEVQAIGGVNEKIEGFFDVCDIRGLSGDQGVIIPRSNVRHLMIRQRVRDAVRDGKFNIYAIDHIDQGLAILTGLEAGTRNSQGEYPAESLNGKICDSLNEMAERRHAYAVTKKDSGSA
ncbi:MAG: AAA family ATPase [Gammaproteobacteria bacterium]